MVKLDAQLVKDETQSAQDYLHMTDMWNETEIQMRRRLVQCIPPDVLRDRIWQLLNGNFEGQHECSYAGMETKVKQFIWALTMNQTIQNA